MGKVFSLAHDSQKVDYSSNFRHSLRFVGSFAVSVSRPRKEDPMGETAARFPPWPSGKDSKGNRLGIGFLWRFLLPLSLAAKKVARRRQLDENIGRNDP